MSSKAKLLERFKSKPNDFTFRELVTMLKSLGYTETNRGRTSGSAVKFYNVALDSTIFIHKPHPDGILKKGVIDIVYNELRRVDLL